MLALYILVALFIAWIWVDYFRLIDLFDKNNLPYVLVVFLLGASTIGIVFLLDNFVIAPSGWQLEGGFLNHLLYSIFAIGLVEEIAKLMPFLLFFRIFRKYLIEPIDYIAFICISALGFSAAENVLYFQRHGSGIITSRAILCSISHMFNSAIVAYGFILFRFHPKFLYRPGIIFAALFLAAISHGIYNFWLLYEAIAFGFLITLFFFFCTLSLFATILNNTINNSGQFTYKKAIDIDLLSNRMLTYYGVVFVIQLILVGLEEGFIVGLVSLIYSLFATSLIVFVSVVRLSRFQLIEGRWNRLKFELPFHFGGTVDTFSHGFRPFGIRIKGPSLNEFHLSKFYQEFAYMQPFSAKVATSEKVKLIYLEKKIFLKNDVTYFVARLYNGNQYSPFETILLKPKVSGRARTRENFPIVGRMQIEEIEDPKNPGQFRKKYRFVEWVFLRSVTMDQSENRL